MSFYLEAVSNIYLRSKVSDMGLLLLQDGARHEDREVAVLDSQILDSLVQPVSNVLPDRERPGTQNVAATHIVVLDQFSFGDHLNT